MFGAGNVSVCIWDTPGGINFIEEICQSLLNGQNVVIPLLSGWKKNLWGKIQDKLRETDIYLWKKQLTGMNSVFPLNALKDFPGLFQSDEKVPETIDDFVNCLAEKQGYTQIYWLDEMDEPDIWTLWKKFIEVYSHRIVHNLPIFNRILFCIPLEIDKIQNYPKNDAALTVLTPKFDWLDIEINIILWVRRNGGYRPQNESECELHRQISLSIISHLAMTDTELMEEMLTLPLKTLCSPQQFFENYIFNQLDKKFNFKNIKTCKIGHLDYYHPIYLATKGNWAELERRIWKAQLPLIMPLIEEIRLKFIYEHSLEQKLRPPFMSREGEPRQSVLDLEASEIAYFIKQQKIPFMKSDLSILFKLKDARNSLAHRRSVPWNTLNEDLFISSFENKFHWGV